MHPDATSPEYTAGPRRRAGHPYAQLRQAAAPSRDRSLRSKVMSLEDATTLVQDGDTVGIGGSTMSRTPMGMIWALDSRAQVPSLVRSQHRVERRRSAVRLRHLRPHHHQLVQPGNPVGRLEGDAPSRRDAARRRYDEWSHMAIGMRFRAGAMGLPFMPIRSMLGSDVASATAGGDRDRSARTPARSSCSCRRSTLTWPHPRAALRRVRQRADRRPAVHGHRPGDGCQPRDPDDRAHRLERADSPRTRPHEDSVLCRRCRRRAARSAARRTSAPASTSR